MPCLFTASSRRSCLTVGVRFCRRQLIYARFSVENRPSAADSCLILSVENPAFAIKSVPARLCMKPASGGQDKRHLRGNNRVQLGPVRTTHTSRSVFGLALALFRTSEIIPSEVVERAG